MSEINLKLVVCTRIWSNQGTPDLPMWRTMGGKEYIVKYFDHEPTIEEIGNAVADAEHMIVTLDTGFKETVDGWQLYLTDNMTNNEYFQLTHNNAIDFPANDITDIQIEDDVE
jgi:hypothetical protein